MKRHSPYGFAAGTTLHTDLATTDLDEAAWDHQ